MMERRVRPQQVELSAVKGLVRLLNIIVLIIIFPKFQIVGCDGLISSSFRFDACGVCGGRGDTCDNGKFIWKVSGRILKIYNNHSKH